MTVDYTKPYQAPPAPPQVPQQKSSTGCWKWGALGCVILSALAVFAFVGIVVFVFGMMRSNDAYREALRRAQSNPDVIAALGTPIEAGWWVTGNVNATPGHGEARIVFPIHGPRGKATVRVEAAQQDSRWVYSLLRVQLDHGREIDLLAGENR